MEKEKLVICWLLGMPLLMLLIGAALSALLSSRFDLMPPSGGTVDLGGLRRYWRSRGYRVVNETGGQDAQLLVENPADRFRLGVTQRTARYVKVCKRNRRLARDLRPLCFSDAGWSARARYPRTSCPSSRSMQLPLRP